MLFAYAGLTLMPMGSADRNDDRLHAVVLCVDEATARQVFDHLCQGRMLDGLAYQQPDCCTLTVDSHSIGYDETTVRVWSVNIWAC